MSKFRDALLAEEFVITGEVAPPLGTDLTGLKKSIEILGLHCHAINVTDNQGATLHLSSLAASRVVLDMGVEPIFQQTCRDRNRLALQSDLLAAWTLGLRNVLVVTGDDPRAGDHPQAKGVFDLDSTQLMSIVRGMNEGHDMMGRELSGATDLYIGGAMFPEAEPWDIQLTRALRKAEAGAEFFQTQAVFDIDKIARTTEEMHAAGAKVIAGILLLKGPRVIDFINNKLAGLMVPEHIERRIKDASDPAAEAIELAREQVAACREVCDGVHIMPLGLDSAVPHILGVDA
ncbi:MAG: methylenetetrahydrofolate reductase [Actinobacteria bacterium]|nr:methylenetetrahydrofolate reductase [Actinomycetota bacterium]MCG2807879.1 methylenetetrahydrofolate reductase [Coriobacteriia bacterium]